jgi:xylulokinase
MYLMGIDVGTSGCKTAVFDLDGNTAAYAGREYPLICPAAGAMELDPDRVWDAVCACLEECRGKCRMADVAAVAVSSQGEAVIPVDRAGKVLCNAPVTFDSRNEKECAWFSEQFDGLEILKTTGAPIHPMFSATKILWLKNNHPDVYDKAWKLFCFSDFIAFRLGASPRMDFSLASRTLLFDIGKKEWSHWIISRCGIEACKMPEAVPSGTEIGSVSPAVAGRFGFSKSCRIVAGGHDQLCCSLGAGVLRGGQIMDSLGTTESMVCVSSELLLKPGMAKHNIPCSVYPVHSLYAYMTFLTCSGSLLRWMKENIFHSNDENFYFHFDKYVENNYSGPGEIMVLPYFSGAGTPFLDFRARGMIAGLTLDTNRYQIYQALMESTCLEQKRNLENMKDCGIATDELRCIGGGSRSQIWLKIKADVTGRRVLSMKIREAGCLGAAILAGLGSGIFGSAEEAVGRYVKIGREYLPDPKRREAYRERFEKYRMLYPALRQMGV